MMSPIFTLLSFIVIAAPMAAIPYYPPLHCSSIELYDGDQKPAGRRFTANKEICKGAIESVQDRTPTREAVGECAAYILNFSGTSTPSREHVEYMVKCPATPAAVWIAYNEDGYGVYYVPNSSDTGCNAGNSMVAAMGYAFGTQFRG